MNYKTIAQVRDAGIARVLIVALRAHGFHPLDPREGGLPGVPNLFGANGVGSAQTASASRCRKTKWPMQRFWSRIC